ncbi:MAG TPA: hypothetical protein PKO02_02310 [Candidatus Pacearchaeota archaeon]|nr:hypothetical protein [Candidatus Pacearchaeota archaeon]HOH04281.1 hypothetical protein [Candidatus Pacearchaeota archaeon]
MTPLCNELFDISNLNSLVRAEFNKEINLKDYDTGFFRTPKNFKDFSFIPKKGLNLSRIIDTLEDDLTKKGADYFYLSQTIPGICEAIKNAYEHGNLEDNNKNIFLLRNFSKGNIEYVVGDEGGTINGNFIPYIFLIRENKKENSLDSAKDFYSFCGKNYAPKGHSGVGTKTMHKCFNQVKYFKNEQGGLMVNLIKPSF